MSFEAQGLKKGAVIRDAGFISTSKSQGAARQFAQVSRNKILMEIRAKKGASALDLMVISDAPSEAEVLFARGVDMKVVSFN